MKPEQHKKAPGCMQYAIIFFILYVLIMALTKCSPAPALQSYSFTVVKIESQRPGKKNVYVIDSTRRGLWVMTCKCDSVKVGDQFTSSLKKY